MKTKNLILLLFSVLTMIACEKNEKKYGKGSEEIIGYWVYSSTSDSIITYERKDSLEINNYGFAFK